MVLVFQGRSVIATETVITIIISVIIILALIVTIGIVSSLITLHFKRKMMRAPPFAPVYFVPPPQNHVELNEQSIIPHDFIAHENLA